MIRVLVVDDSPTARELIALLLGEDEEIEVVGQAVDGRQAIEMATRLRPDVVTMDVVMPDMDGLEATRRIMAEAPTRIIIVTAYAHSPELDVVFESMIAGAMDVVAKPTLSSDVENEGWKREIVAKIKALGGFRPRPLGEGDVRANS